MQQKQSKQTQEQTNFEYECGLYRYYGRGGDSFYFLQFEFQLFTTPFDLLAMLQTTKGGGTLPVSSS